MSTAEPRSPPGRDDDVTAEGRSDLGDGADAHPSPDEPTRADRPAHSGTIDATGPAIENGAISDARRRARRGRAGFALIAAAATVALVGSAFAILGGRIGAPAGAPEVDEPVMSADSLNAAKPEVVGVWAEDSRRLDLRVRRRTGALPSRLRSHLRTPSQSARLGPRSPRDARAAGPPALPERDHRTGGGVVRPHPCRISARPVRGMQAQRRRHSRGRRCAGRCGFDLASPARAHAGPPPRGPDRELHGRLRGRERRRHRAGRPPHRARPRVRLFRAEPGPDAGRLGAHAGTGGLPGGRVASCR